MGKASREKWERRLARALATAPPLPDNSPSGRFFRFAEHNMSIAAIGIIGGLGSAFLYGPILTICLFMFVLGLHRSRAVKDLSSYVQIVCYASVVILSASILYGLGRAIESHKEHPLTAAEIWKGHTSQPATQTTNIYQTTVPPTPKGPLIDLGEPYPSQNDGKLYFTVDKTNVGDQVAYKALNTADVYVRTLGRQTEDAVFRDLYEKDNKISLDDAVADIGAGISHRSHFNFPAHFSPEDLIKLQDKKNGAYVAALVTYSDSHGIRHSSESCWIYSPLFPVLGTCSRHNFAK
jgi:hypothetical protein